MTFCRRRKNAIAPLSWSINSAQAIKGKPIPSENSSSITAPQCNAGHSQNPDATAERDRNHVAAFHIAARCHHPIAVDPDMPCIDQRRSGAARSHDTGIP